MLAYRFSHKFMANKLQVLDSVVSAHLRKNARKAIFLTLKSSMTFLSLLQRQSINLPSLSSHASLPSSSQDLPGAISPSAMRSKIGLDGAGRNPLMKRNWYMQVSLPKTHFTRT